jgi:hypothetical protein
MASADRRPGPGAAPAHGLLAGDSTHGFRTRSFGRVPASPRLDRNNLEKATGMLGRLAADLSISTQEIRDQARRIVEDELVARDEQDRVHGVLTPDGSIGTRLREPARRRQFRRRATGLRQSMRRSFGCVRWGAGAAGRRSCEPLTGGCLGHVASRSGLCAAVQLDRACHADARASFTSAVQGYELLLASWLTHELIRPPRPGLCHESSRISLAST